MREARPGLAAAGTYPQSLAPRHHAQSLALHRTQDLVFLHALAQDRARGLALHPAVHHPPHGWRGAGGSAAPADCHGGPSGRGQAEFGRADEVARLMEEQTEYVLGEGTRAHVRGERSEAQSGVGA